MNETWTDERNGCVYWLDEDGCLVVRDADGEAHPPTSAQMHPDDVEHLRGYLQAMRRWGDSWLNGTPLPDQDEDRDGEQIPLLVRDSDVPHEVRQLVSALSEDVYYLAKDLARSRASAAYRSANHLSLEDAGGGIDPELLTEWQPYPLPEDVEQATRILEAQRHLPFEVLGY